MPNTIPCDTQSQKTKKVVHLNREKSIPNSYVRAKVGTTNILNPSSIYIELSFFVMPPEHLTEQSMAKEIVSHLKKRFNSIVKSTVLSDTDIFKPGFIAIFDTAASGMRPRKKSYVSAQVSLGQIQNPRLPLDEVISLSTDSILLMILKTVSEFEQFGFTVYSKKS